MSCCVLNPSASLTEFLITYYASIEPDESHEREGSFAPFNQESQTLLRLHRKDNNTNALQHEYFSFYLNFSFFFFMVYA